MALTTVNQIRTELSLIQASHLQINSFFWGDFLRAYKEDEATYPLMGAFYPNGTLLQRQNQLTLTYYVADKVFKDDSNLHDVESDTLQICRDIYRTINDSVRWKTIGRVTSATFSKFIQRGGDEVAGHQVTMNFLVRDIGGVCGMPMGDYDFDQTITPFVCHDGTVTIYDTGGDILHTVVVASGGEATQIITDSTVNLRNSLGTPLGTISIKAEASALMFAPDADVENSDSSYIASTASGASLVLPDSQVNVNGVDEGDAVSVKAINVTLTDGVTDITPTSSSLVGNDLTIVAPRATWTRPADWLEIDSLVDASMHRWVGLMAVYDETVATNPQNYLTLYSSQAYTVNVDGVITNYGAGTRAELQVTWASVVGTTTSEGFRQSIIQVYPQVGSWTGSFYCSYTRTTAPTNAPIQLLDIRASLPNVSFYQQNFFSAGINTLWLKKSAHLSAFANTFSMANFYSYSPVEQISHVNFTTTTSLSAFANSVTGSLAIGDISTNATNILVCQGSNAKSIGNITANSAIVASTMIYYNPNLESVGNVSLTGYTGSVVEPMTNNPNLRTSGTWTIPLFTSLASAFRQNPKLQSLTLVTGAGLTNITTICQNNFSLTSLSISDCSGVTTTTGALTGCSSLSELSLVGLTRGITIPPCRMQDADFANTFNSLGIASGAQTITKTGNVLCSAPTLAIATGKGYTVVE